MLIVNGSTPVGVADASGNLLDGNGDGKPGDNYVAILRGFGLEKMGAPFSRLICDQLHGQPLSSRAVITNRAHSASVSRAAPGVMGRVNRGHGVVHPPRAVPTPNPVKFRLALPPRIHDRFLNPTPPRKLGIARATSPRPRGPTPGSLRRVGSPGGIARSCDHESEGPPIGVWD